MLIDMNREPFALEEWYHCLNRGVDKREVFLTHHDYERFLMLLASANSNTPVHLGEYRQGSTLAEVVTTQQEKPLVSLGAYCLMPNHFHLLLKEITEGGIALFMQKVGTGYTMYFNQKEGRTGSLFGGRFKSKHIADDRYLKRVVNYIHANPAELTEPRWKEGIIHNKRKTKEFLAEYRYSSLFDYLSPQQRPQATLLDRASLLSYYECKRFPTIVELLEDAQTFARDKEIALISLQG